MKMSKSKKVFNFFVMIIVVSLFAACSNEAGTQQSTPQKQESKQEPFERLVKVQYDIVLGSVNLIKAAFISAGTLKKGGHIVRRGEFLRLIASRYNVGWEAMLLANERFLQTKYQEVCSDLSRNFRNRRQDRGTRKGGQYYCNDRYNRPYGNTLRPGWRLAIPEKTAPTAIAEIVSKIKGDKIALVIDDTGSMSDDRQKVSEFYLAALRQYNKRIVGVWLYADNQVRKYEDGGIRLLTEGSYENTFGALTIAAREKPDAIILVTDEPGDDWQWSEVSSLPPVIGHCLPDSGTEGCRETIQRLATETRGQFVLGIKK